jgi:hypothetical protein
VSTGIAVPVTHRAVFPGTLPVLQSDNRKNLPSKPSTMMGLFSYATRLAGWKKYEFAVRKCAFPIGDVMLTACGTFRAA